MRYPWFMLAAVLLGAAAANAQQTPPGTPGAGPPARPPADTTFDPTKNRLDAVLLNWERSMAPLQSLQAQCQRTTVDATFKATTVMVGIAKYIKPNLALLDLRDTNKDRPDHYEKFVSSGTYLFQYAPDAKKIRYKAIPAPQPGQVAEDNVLTFIFGIKAATAKQTYDLRLGKEDQHYFYIDIFPIRRQDMADFQQAQLVLAKETYLPRRLWFKEPNGNTVTWDLPRIDRDVRLDRNEFVKPDLPPGWTMEKMEEPKAAAEPPVPPRVVRPNNP